jgi:hypothetical protein
MLAIIMAIPVLLVVVRKSSADDLSYQIETSQPGDSSPAKTSDLILPSKIVSLVTIYLLIGSFIKHETKGSKRGISSDERYAL